MTDEINEYCRPASLEDLKALIESLNRQHVDYLLIGGYALFVHGYHRATTDIDVLVPATLESGAKVKEALMVLPDQAAKDLEPEWFAEGDNIRVADAFVVDVMLNACGETFDTLEQYAITVDLEGIPVRTVSLKDSCEPNRPCETKTRPTGEFWNAHSDSFRNKPRNNDGRARLKPLKQEIDCHNDFCAHRLKRSHRMFQN